MNCPGCGTEGYEVLCPVCTGEADPWDDAPSEPIDGDTPMFELDATPPERPHEPVAAPAATTKPLQIPEADGGTRTPDPFITRDGAESQPVPLSTSTPPSATADEAGEDSDEPAQRPHDAPGTGPECDGAGTGIGADGYYQCGGCPACEMWTLEEALEREAALGGEGDGHAQRPAEPDHDPDPAAQVPRPVAGSPSTPAAVPEFEAAALFDLAPDPQAIALNLRDRYVVPPFSVLDTRQGYWQERRHQWLGLGIKSEIGRNDGLLGIESLQSDAYGFSMATTSIFDPVLAEIAYRWLCPSGGTVLDPFAGGSVRGILAAALGLQYVGVELRGEQVEANREQAAEIMRGKLFEPEWIEGDSTDATLQLPAADLVFTCPPYADLEVYSDHPRDLSNMSADDFDGAYRLAIALAVERLKRDRFACVVIGNVRDKRGRLRDLCGLTIQAFDDAGADYYNEAVLLNAVGTGAVRARGQFEASRKFVRMHQNVLVFVKGDPKAATAAIEAGQPAQEQAA